VLSVEHELKDRAEQKGLKIDSTLPKNSPAVMIDEEKIRHVLFNFVDNAIKYSTKGTIMVSVRREDKSLVVEVKDRGFGFDKVDAANFFQKFYRGNNVKGTNVNGTGLGLYVCRKFIEAHQGKIWATSTGLGKGSVFGFSVPLDHTG
jgi:signal transduction histidine kinase